MDNDENVKLDKACFGYEFDHKKDNELLQVKLREMEFRNMELELEVKALKGKTQELEGRIVSMEKGRQVNAEQVENVADMPAAVNKAIQDGGNEDNRSGSSAQFPFVVTPKSRRLQKVVTSDSESDDDDSIPIGQLVRKKSQGRAVSESEASDFTPHKRRRLVKLSQHKIDGSDKDDDSDDSDDDSLGDFIDSSSDVGEDVAGSEEEASDDSSADFDDILHRIRRSKDKGSEWELEGDMLAALGKDPLLCMKAVCAIYRRESQGEQGFYGTFILDGRGFNKYDKYRGAILADFLTGGDPDGDVVKSVEELKAYDPNGVEVCEKLAKRYSKQLFDIYQNAEDPYFFPPPH